MNNTLHKLTSSSFLKSPKFCLILMACCMPISFASWNTLLNNFVIEMASFDGKDIGLVQSIREIPGFLAFAAVFFLLLIKEQYFAYISLLLLGLGTALTGYFPSLIGICITTTIMSIGFHYYETVQTSLSLQWLSKKEAPIFMGKVIAVASATSLVVFSLIWLSTSFFDLSYKVMYTVAGCFTILITVFCWINFPLFAEKEPQHKKIVLRKRYSLYYALVFMSGARRQIFVVFAAFLMVEKFGFSVAYISALFLINAAMSIFIAPKIGQLISRFGERKMLSIEYIGLFLVFIGYAFNDSPIFAALLYVINHMFFAMSIAIKTYFQKIADPKDISSTAAVGFTINHIAAVFLPFLLGILWINSPEWVFYFGSILALISLLLSRMVPNSPCEGNETQRLLRI